MPESSLLVSRLTELSLVSVIMPNLNKGKFVRQAIESVLVQTHTNLELIVVDGGSSDESLSIIEELQKKDSRIFCLNEPKAGVSFSRNLAIRKASGQLIAFLDSDDLYSRDKLSKQVELYRRGQLFICYTNGWIINDSGCPTGKIFNRDLKPIPNGSSDGYIFSQLLRSNYVIGPSVMMPKEFFTYEKFDTTLPIGEDTDLWVRLSRKFPFRYVSEPLYGYRIYEGNTWSKKNEVKILKSHALRYEKWLEIFDGIDEADKKIIIKNLWSCYIRLNDWSSLTKLALRYRLAFSLLLSRMQTSLLRMFRNK